MRPLPPRLQRTLAETATISGVGFLTGLPVRLCMKPAPADTGVVFIRPDLRPAARLPARSEYVTGTNRRTTLGHAPEQVNLIEHVLAALAGLRIDNCIIELDGPEPPGLDGSARNFVEALLAAGIITQNAQRSRCTVNQTVMVSQSGATLALHPHTDPNDLSLKISYLLDYGPGSPIDRQSHTTEITPAIFASDIAPCRTFVLMEEAEMLRAQGIGRHMTPADLLVFGPRGPVDNRTRYANEPARHKILDVVGDLSLAGCDLVGHVVAYRSGHPLNVELVRKLCGSAAMSGTVRKAA